MSFSRTTLKNASTLQSTCRLVTEWVTWRQGRGQLRENLPIFQEIIINKSPAPRFEELLHHRLRSFHLITDCNLICTLIYFSKSLHQPESSRRRSFVEINRQRWYLHNKSNISSSKSYRVMTSVFEEAIRQFLFEEIKLVTTVYHERYSGRVKSMKSVRFINFLLVLFAVGIVNGDQYDDGVIFNVYTP